MNDLEIRAALIRNVLANAAAAAFFLACLAVGLLITLPAKTQVVYSNIFRPSTPSQVMAVDTTARTATGSFFRTGVAMFTCTAACYFDVSLTPMVTTTTGAYIPAGSPRLFHVGRSERIGVVLSTGTGTIIIEELSR